MEMDGLDSAKCQKSRRRDMMRIFELLMIIRQKCAQCCLLHFETNWAVAGTEGGVGADLRFLVREGVPSL